MIISRRVAVNDLSKLRARLVETDHFQPFLRQIKRIDNQLSQQSSGSPVERMLDGI